MTNPNLQNLDVAIGHVNKLAETMNKYGAGLVAIAIIFVLFIFIIIAVIAYMANIVKKS